MKIALTDFIENLKFSVKLDLTGQREASDLKSFSFLVRLLFLLLFLLLYYEEYHHSNKRLFALLLKNIVNGVDGMLHCDYVFKNCLNIRAGWNLKSFPLFSASTVDGGYSDWSKFSECNASCGRGVKIRKRSCNSPKPMNGGKDCSGLGPAIEYEACNSFPCRMFDFFSHHSP